MDTTRRVAEFVAGTTYEAIPARAVENAKEAILDSVGVALAGSSDPAASICAEMAREEEAREEASLFGQGFRSSAMLAAFANGTASHALDFDASFAVGGQPMAGLAATAFAISEAGHLTGRELLAGYVAGFELTGKLARTIPSLSQGGWHSTATLGSLGCVATAARLLRLDVDQTCMALGMASSMAGGVGWNFGTMTKPLHAGLAARNGVLAARLAAKGFSANPGSLEGSDRSFFQSFARNPSPDLEYLEELGLRFELEGRMRFKPYPCGGLVHSAVDAALALRAEHGLLAGAIDRVEVRVTPYTAHNIVYRIPETGLQGKFSVPYIIARAVIDGGLTPDSFSEEAIREPAVLALAERITMEADPSLEDTASVSRPSSVSIQMKDGRSLFRRVDHARGSAEAPFSRADLEAKFQSCAQRTMDAGAAAETMVIIENLEAFEDVSALATTLMGEKV